MSTRIHPARQTWNSAALAIETYRDQYQTHPDQLDYELDIRGTQARQWEWALE